MSGLRLHNTLTRTKENFDPLDPKNVRMYVCGPTVYDFAHIGNARPAIVFDVLFRLLRHLYGEDHVTYVRNITDVDDKINARAAEIAQAKKIPLEAARVEITTATAKQYQDDVGALGCLPPTREPRATEYIRQMVQMIEGLVKAGHAYPAEGHVLYDVSSKRDYGKLARRSLDEMIAGARVDVAPYKKNPMDFVLWKPSSADLPGWHSPWGMGRPGWHIECSAMADALLGETFDIHGGGIDLLFPHHENEIAQSEGAHADHPPARYWMHNGFLQVEGEKMSKSLGNFVTIRELLNDWPGGVLRFAMLQTHYRQPMNWTKDRLEQASKELGEWVTHAASHQSYHSLFTDPSRVQGIVPNARLLDALCDDLNTSNTVAVLRDLFNRARTTDANAMDELIEACVFLGLVSPDTFPAYNWMVMTTHPFEMHACDNFIAQFRTGIANRDETLKTRAKREVETRGFGLGIDPDGVISFTPISRMTDESADIQAMIDARLAARKAKNFKESDRIRDELLAKGIQLKDNPDGTTTWEVKR